MKRYDCPLGGPVESKDGYWVTYGNAASALAEKDKEISALLALLQEIFDWTKYKESAWGRKVSQALEKRRT